MDDEREDTIGDAATGAEEHHLAEAEEPGHDAGGAEDGDDDERSPWAE